MLVNSVASNMMTMSTDIPDQKDLTKRVPKPLMEKRRRDRINHSLETLRLLLVENTRNEKLKNPKVEKAEILESAVNFLKAEQRSRSFSYTMKRGKRKYEEDDEMESPCKRRLNYEDGMRTCLLRVSNFIASKSQDVEESMKKTIQHEFQDHSIQGHLASAFHFRSDGGSVPGQQALTNVESANSCMALGQSVNSQSTDKYESTKKTASICKQPLVLNGSVWRPWPQ